MKNQHGLSRDIPEATKLEIRRACGFGCVICGDSLIQYEHIDPEFKDAKIHDPEAMALLCGGCHDKVTRGTWSKSKVAKARESPRCLADSFSRGVFDIGQQHPYVVIGGMTLRSCRTPISYRGYPLISIDPAELPGGPFRLSATFRGPDGKPSLHVHQNEFQIRGEAWDVESVGSRIKIRSSDGPYTLVLRADPPNGLAVEKLHMCVGNQELKADENALLVGGNSFTGCLADGCEVGLAL